jgi:hypothetical protein
MRTGRAIITSGILVLGLAGPVLATSTVSAAAGPAPAVHVQAAAGNPGLFYHG